MILLTLSLLYVNLLGSDDFQLREWAYQHLDKTLSDTDGFRHYEFLRAVKEARECSNKELSRRAKELYTRHQHRYFGEARYIAVEHVVSSMEDWRPTTDRIKKNGFTIVANGRRILKYPTSYLLRFVLEKPEDFDEKKLDKLKQILKGGNPPRPSQERELQRRRAGN